MVTVDDLINTNKTVNISIGAKELYSFRFDKMFKSFEQLIKEERLQWKIIWKL